MQRLQTKVCLVKKLLTLYRNKKTKKSNRLYKNLLPFFIKIYYCLSPSIYTWLAAGLNWSGWYNEPSL